MEVLEKTSTEITVIADKINIGLAAFEERKEALLELKKEADGLKIESIEDRAAIKQVSEIRKKLKSARVEITKEGKSMRDPLTTISRVISEKEKELVAIIEPTERELQAQEDWVESEKERIRQEEIQKEEARIQTRIDALAQYGYQIDYSDIKAMTDDTFTKYLEAAKAKYEKEQEEKEQAERLRLQQEAEEQAAREAERQRLEAERNELEELRKQQAEAQRIIDEKNAEIAAEQKRIADEKAAIEAQKQKEIEDKRREEETRAAIEKAREEARLKVIEDAKEAERLRIEKEQKEKEEAEKKAQRAPDKTKITEYIKAIRAVPVPTLKTKEANEVMAGIQELISRFDNYASEKAGEL